MRAEWVHSYTEGEPRSVSLRLFADDGSELETLQWDELRLICAVVLTEEPEIAKPFRMETPDGEPIDPEAKS